MLQITRTHLNVQTRCCKLAAQTEQRQLQVCSDAKTTNLELSQITEPSISWLQFGRIIQHITLVL